MSGRRLQQPAPVSTSKYKWLGTSIVTTLATGQIPDVFYGTSLYQIRELPAGQRIRFHKTIRLDGPPDRFLDAQNILADFDGSHIPVFIQSEISIKNPKVAAVQEILEAHGKGFEVKDLIEANFPEGDFQRHLITYLRDMTRANKCCRGESLETRLMDAYVTGVKEWCAQALDVFIIQVERNLSSHIESCEAVKGQEVDEIALWSQRPISKQAASHQEEALRSLVKKTLEHNPECRKEWIKYKAEHLVTHKVTPTTSLLSAEDFYTVLMRKELRFISWLLRNLSSDSFLHEASDIANTLRCFGGPCHLVNLLENMSLYPEDVVEYKRVKNSVQGADDTDLQEAPKPSVTGRLDLPKSIEYMSHPLQILDDRRLAVNMTHDIPPFLQLGYGFVNHGEFKKEAIEKISELWQGQKLDEALAVMDKEFHDAEEFHEHLFGLLRTAMRSYAFSPKLLTSRGSQAYPIYVFDTHLGRLLQANTRALQRWCAQVHGILTEKLDNAIIEAYQSSTKKSKDLIEAVSEVEPTFTQGVDWLMDQIKPSSMRPFPQPEIPLEPQPQVANFRHSLYTLDWLVRIMPWDCFLYFRAHVAKLVREIDRGKEGFSFLVNVLESLSFTDSDVDEFRQYYTEMPELRWSRHTKFFPPSDNIPL